MSAVVHAIDEGCDTNATVSAEAARSPVVVEAGNDGAVLARASTVDSEAERSRRSCEPNGNGVPGDGLLRSGRAASCSLSFVGDDEGRVPR